MVSWLMLLHVKVFTFKNKPNNFYFSLQAVKLLKPGGVLVYSTCTITLSENEEQVAWALKTFPCLQLQPQVILFSGTSHNPVSLFWHCKVTRYIYCQ